MNAATRSATLEDIRAQESPDALKALEDRIRADDGFLTDETIWKLAGLDRLRPVLVRCGTGRFTCPAQDVAGFVAIIEREGTTHVRDVSLTAQDRLFNHTVAPGPDTRLVGAGR